MQTSILDYLYSTNSSLMNNYFTPIDVARVKDGSQLPCSLAVPKSDSRTIPRSDQESGTAVLA